MSFNICIINCLIFLQFSRGTPQEIRAETDRGTNTVRVYTAKLHNCVAGVFIDFITRATKTAYTRNSSGLAGVIARGVDAAKPNWD